MKLMISRAEDNNFEAGLRGFFEYRDLGVKEASLGDFGANVIRAIPGEHSRGEWHYHELNFQMVFILDGWVKFEYEGEGEFIFCKGDMVYQPPEIRHREIEHSDNLELLEITSPAEFKTITI